MTDKHLKVQAIPVSFERKLEEHGCFSQEIGEIQRYPTVRPRRLG
jgi:hypothetical protein